MARRNIFSPITDLWPATSWMIRHRALPRVAWLIGFMRNNNKTIAAWPDPADHGGAVPLGPRVALFVHFDRAGELRDHVAAYLRALAAAGLDVVLVSNSGKMKPESEQVARSICRAVLIRRNVGYDFGAWADALTRLGLPRADTELIVMANDSVYGPFRPLDDVLAAMDFSAGDVWGLTESWQARFHLQSYFMAVGTRALNSLAWRAFWAEVRPVPSKNWVVYHYEIGLSQALLRGGMRLRSVWNYADLVELIDPLLLRKEVPRDDDDDVNIDPAVTVRRAHALRIRDHATQRTPLNPTSDLWRQLLDSGYPFLKRELLRDNPTHVQDVFEWRRTMERMEFDPTHIDRDLQRALRRRSP